MRGMRKIDRILRARPYALEPRPTGPALKRVPWTLFSNQPAGRDDGRDHFSPREIQHLLVMLNHLAQRFSYKQMEQIMAAVLQNEGLRGMFILSVTHRRCCSDPRTVRT
jgi:hypothetical protein